MKSYTAYIMVRPVPEMGIHKELLVNTMYHSDKSKLVKNVQKFISDNQQGNFLDCLSQDDFYFEIEEFFID